MGRKLQNCGASKYACEWSWAHRLIRVSVLKAKQFFRSKKITLLPYWASNNHTNTKQGRAVQCATCQAGHRAQEKKAETNKYPAASEQAVAVKKVYDSPYSQLPSQLLGHHRAPIPLLFAVRSPLPAHFWALVPGLHFITKVWLDNSVLRGQKFWFLEFTIHKSRKAGKDMDQKIRKAMGFSKNCEIL